MKATTKDNICKMINVIPNKPDPDSMIGLAINSLDNKVINGLRHPIEGNSNGWYIWSGEYSESEDFFAPVCIKHLQNYFDIDLIEYLDLPVGYRFLIDDNSYEDVWFDKNLLNI